MFKALAVTAALAFPLLVASPAAAQAPSCVPLDVIVEEAESYDLDVTIIMESQQAGFIEAYTEAVGKPLPDGLDVVGILFATGDNYPMAFIGLIQVEDERYCIHLSTRIPRANHEIARGAAAAGT